LKPSTKNWRQGYDFYVPRIHPYLLTL